MKGMRPLSNEEIRKVAGCFEGAFKVRNRALFMLGVSCGGRISELLSLTVGDVWQNDKPVTDIHFGKNIVKGKKHARTVPLNIDGRTAIQDLMAFYDKHYFIYDNTPLFKSRVGNLALTRKGADDVLKKAFEKAGLNGKLATHSLRKSYAQRLYDMTQNILIVKEMLGHQSVATTEKYIGVNYREVREASEAMAVENEGNRNITPIWKASVSSLVLELIKRGYETSLKPLEPKEE